MRFSLGSARDAIALSAGCAGDAATGTDLDDASTGDLAVDTLPIDVSESDDVSDGIDTGRCGRGRSRRGRRERNRW